MIRFVAGERTEFVGTLKQHRTWYKANMLAERWLLLVDVVRSDTEQLIAKQVWLREGKWSRNMKKGHRYSFSARVQPCRDIQDAPGISGRIDQEWRISNPSKVREREMSPIATALDGAENATIKFHGKSRKKPRRSGKRSAAQLFDDNPRATSTGRGRVKQWTG